MKSFVVTNGVDGDEIGTINLTNATVKSIESQLCYAGSGGLEISCRTTMPGTSQSQKITGFAINGIEPPGMTLDEFANTRWRKGMACMYQGKTMVIQQVDFFDASIGLESFSGIKWVNCQDVTMCE